MDEYTSMVRIWELTCPGLPQEVGRARRWTRDILSETPWADDAALIVTELGSNALRHSASGSDSGSFHFTLIRSASAVVIAVTDIGSSLTTPHVEKPDEDDTHGRGLELVAALAYRVHVRGDDRHGHTVTAELHLDSAPAGADIGTIPRPGAATC